MRNIRKFDNRTTYNSSRLFTPAVSLIGDENVCAFAPGPKTLQFIDLGLPSGTLWCTHNIGATNDYYPKSWYGNLYAWGEIEPKSSYSWANHKWANGAKEKLTKYCYGPDAWWDGEGTPDRLYQLLPEDDIAYLTNPAWRIPTKDQIDELCVNTTKTQAYDYNKIVGLAGWIFKSKINGNYIFIPTMESYISSSELQRGYSADIWCIDYDHVNAASRAKGYRIRPVMNPTT